MMRYLEYLLGSPVDFAVADRASPQQVAARLKVEVRSRLWPFHFEKVVGRVGAETLSIEWHGSVFGSNMAPRLTGRLTSAGAGTKFEGRFGEPVFLRFFLILWVCFDLIFAISMLSGSAEGGPPPSFLFPFLLVHLLMPFGIVAAGMIGADKVRQRLIAFVIDVGSGQRAAI